MDDSEIALAKYLIETGLPREIAQRLSALGKYKKHFDTSFLIEVRQWKSHVGSKNAPYEAALVIFYAETKRKEVDKVFDGMRAIVAISAHHLGEGADFEKARLLFSDNKACDEILNDPVKYNALIDQHLKSAKMKSDSQIGDGKCFIATAIYGKNARETNKLRAWRDSFLMTSRIGRFFVLAYYKLAPLVMPIINRYGFLRNLVKRLLDRLVAYLD